MLDRIKITNFRFLLLISMSNMDRNVYVMNVTNRQKSKRVKYLKLVYLHHFHNSRGIAGDL